MYFMGTHTPKLDDKGRLILPAKFRERLAEGLVVTQGQEKCLDVWPADVFMAEAARAESRGMTSRMGRDYARMLFARAEQGTPDKQGRIGLSQPLRDYASLERDVVVVGAMDRVEIWEPSRWREYCASAEEKFAALDEERLTGPPA
ncbi:division/cell wall cluster transcriptional repressor MraZ [Nocardioides sp.]|uniref:division/cell wall cluster transcriptional repressor MraZ n=1 Tax=Nocardioides sp. TaxID=35761 RepID=UPI003564BDA2